MIRGSKAGFPPSAGPPRKISGPWSRLNVRAPPTEDLSCNSPHGKEKPFMGDPKPVIRAPMAVVKP